MPHGRRTLDQARGARALRHQARVERGVQLPHHRPKTHHPLLPLAQRVVVEGPLDLLPRTQVTVIAFQRNQVRIRLADVRQGGSRPLQEFAEWLGVRAFHGTVGFIALKHQLFRRQCPQPGPRFHEAANGKNLRAPQWRPGLFGEPFPQVQPRTLAGQHHRHIAQGGAVLRDELAGYLLEE